MRAESGRLAGLANPKELLEAKDAQAARAAVDMPAVTYGRLFAEHNGRGAGEQSAFAAVVEAYGPRRAASLRAICWYFHWGNFTGNTLDAILGRKPGREGMGMGFMVFVLLYYGPLFFCLFLFNQFLRHLPKGRCAACFMSMVGVVFTSVAALWILPVGVIGFLVGGCHSQHELTAHGGVESKPASPAHGPAQVEVGAAMGAV